MTSDRSIGDDLLECETLHILRNSDQPVGAVLLHLRLSEKHKTSMATAGRILSRMDWAGLTTKVGNRGRVITKEGNKRLEELTLKMASARHGEFLSRLFQISSWRRLIEVLEMREALESHVARLAAQRATPDAVSLLEAAVAQQRDTTMRDLPASDEDVHFHDLIAQTSGNSVARSVLAVIRNRSELSPFVAAFRREVGGQLVHEHEAILDAIRQQDGDAAEAAMRSHIRNLAKDVVAYSWTHTSVAERDGGRYSAEGI